MLDPCRDGGERVQKLDKESASAPFRIAKHRSTRIRYRVSFLGSTLRTLERRAGRLVGRQAKTA